MATKAASWALSGRRRFIESNMREIFGPQADLTPVLESLQPQQQPGSSVVYYIESEHVQLVQTHTHTRALFC